MSISKLFFVCVLSKHNDGDKMQIKTNQTANFKATRVLVTEKSLARGKKELVEVYRLNSKEDADFIKKCLDVLSITKTNKLTAFQKRLKVILKGFLDKTTSLTEDFYISIKDNEEIIGCMNSVPLIKNVIPLNVFVSKNVEQNANTMLYSLLKDSQINYKGYNINTKEIAKKFPLIESKIKFDQINFYKKNIREKFSSINFKPDNTKNVNLDQVLGTENFETNNLLKF